MKIAPLAPPNCFDTGQFLRCRLARTFYLISFLVSAAVDRSRYSLVSVPQLDVSVVVNGNAAGGSSCETVLASVGHRLSTLNVE